MKKFAVPLVAAALALAGCGGHSSNSPVKVGPTGQREYKLNGHLSPHPPGWGHPPPGTKVQAPRPLALSQLAPQDQYDTITLSTVNRGMHYLAGYTAGWWPTYNGLLGEPWHPRVVSIAISAGYHAMCLDVEPGDAVPSQAPYWVTHDTGVSFVGGKPCVYSSYWEFENQVFPDLGAAHIARGSYWAWDADYTYVRHVDAGFDLTQYTDKAFGLNLDASAMTNAFANYNPTPPLPVCFHKRESKAACSAVKSRIAGYQRAVTNSTGAYNARSCPVFAQRVAWFSHTIKTQPRSIRTASRKRALAASQKAYKARSCGLFAARVGLYSNLIKQAEASN